MRALVDIEPSTIVSLCGFVVFLWLGLYALAREPRVTSTSLGGAGLLLAAVYLLSSAAMENSRSLQEGIPWIRLAWVAIPLFIRLWQHMILELAGWPTRGKRWLLGGLYATTFVVIGLGLSTNLVHDYSSMSFSAEGARHFTGPVGLLYGPVVGFDVAVFAASLAILLVRLRREHASLSPRPHRRLLFYGLTVLFAGGVLLGANAVLRWDVPEGFIQSVWLAGAAVVAVRVVGSGRGLEDQIHRGDLRGSLLGAFVLSSAVVSVMLLLRASVLTTAVVLGLALTQLAFAERLKALFQRPFVSASVWQERESLAKAAQNVVGPGLVQLDGVDDTELEQLTLEAVKHLSPATSLLESPLIHIPAVERRLRANAEDREGNGYVLLSQDKATALSELLQELIEGLRAGLDDDSATLDDAWGPFCALRYHVLRSLRLSKGQLAPLDVKVLAWREQRRSSYHKMLKECEKQAVASIARSLRELSEDGREHAPTAFAAATRGAYAGQATPPLARETWS